jgi:hypothetical protein
MSLPYPPSTTATKAKIAAAMISTSIFAQRGGTQWKAGRAWLFVFEDGRCAVVDERRSRQRGAPVCSGAPELQSPVFDCDRKEQKNGEGYVEEGEGCSAFEQASFV